MVACPRAVAVLPAAAAAAADFVGGMVAGAVDGDQQMPAEQGPPPGAFPRRSAAWMPVRRRRRARGSASSSRRRIHVSDGARPTPDSGRRFRAITGSPPPRTCRPDCGSDGILEENTAGPDIRQSERPMPRVLMGSGMRWRHARTARSIPGIDRCFRKGFPDIFLPGFCLSVRRMADPVRKVHEKKFATPAQQTDNERKEFLAGIAGWRIRRRSPRTIWVGQSGY